MFYWCAVYLSIVGVSGVILNTSIIALYWGNKKVRMIYFCTVYLSVLHWKNRMVRYLVVYSVTV